VGVEDWSLFKIVERRGAVMDFDFKVGKIYRVKFIKTSRWSIVGWEYLFLIRSIIDNLNPGPDFHSSTRIHHSSTRIHQFETTHAPMDLARFRVHTHPGNDRLVSTVACSEGFLECDRLNVKITASYVYEAEEVPVRDLPLYLHWNRWPVFEELLKGEPDV
jgi:hypothetical protein